MYYVFNKGEKNELEVFSSSYLPEESVVIYIWDNDKERDVLISVKTDENSKKYFTWNKKKYFINGYYKYSKEDIINHIKDKSLTSSILIQGVLNYGIDKVILKVPYYFYSSDINKKKTLVSSTLEKHSIFEIWDDYKVETKAIDYNRCTAWYVTDLVTMLNNRTVEIDFKVERPVNAQ